MRSSFDGLAMHLYFKMDEFSQCVSHSLLLQSIGVYFDRPCEVYDDSGGYVCLPMI